MHRIAKRYLPLLMYFLYCCTENIKLLTYNIVRPTFDMQPSCLGPPFANRYIANLLAVGAGRRSRSSLQENAVHPLHAENVINRTVVSLRGLTKRQCKQGTEIFTHPAEQTGRQTDRRTKCQQNFKGNHARNVRASIRDFFIKLIL